MKKKRVNRSKPKSIKSNVLKKTYPFLNILYNHDIPKNMRLKILEKTNGDKDLLNSVKEISHNVKKGNLKIQKGNGKISPYMDKILNFTPQDCKHSGKSKKCKVCKTQIKALKDGDGILAIAIPALASLAGSYLAS